MRRELTDAEAQIDDDKSLRRQLQVQLEGLLTDKEKRLFELKGAKQHFEVEAAKTKELREQVATLMTSKTERCKKEQYTRARVVS